MGKGQPKQATTGGDIVAHALRLRGINTVFCLAGAAHAHTLYALERHKFHIVSSRHETSTVSQADGYARVSGKPGVAMVAGYQGLPSVLAGVRTAQLACSPVVVLASVSPPSAQEALGEESNDPLDIVKPYVKWARTVPHAERLGEFLNAALHQAVAGRPGVAVLGITQQQQAAAVSPPAAAKNETSKEARRAAPVHTAIEQAATAIRRAKRPLLLVGSGAALADAGPAVQRLANAFGIPVLGHALGRGLVPEDMRLGFPWSLAQPAAREADVVIAAGIRLTQRIGYGLPPRFAEDATFIQIDTSAEEIGRNRPIHVPIVGDAGVSLDKLRQELDRHGDAKDRWTPNWVHEAIAPRLARLQELAELPAPPLHPVHIGRELARIMPSDSIFVADGADVYNWMSGTVPVRAARSYLDHYPLGSMGVGLPLAIGAAAAIREARELNGGQDKPVVLVTGDGSFGFYLAEINSAVLAGLRVICVVANDGAWGTEKNAQLHSQGATVNCELGQCDYHLIAKVFGCRGDKVETPRELTDALSRAFDVEVTTVINVLTDPTAGLARKRDPRLQMVTFEDLPVHLETSNE